jgi:hypothetical protein
VAGHLLVTQSAPADEVHGPCDISLIHDDSPGRIHLRLQIVRQGCSSSNVRHVESSSLAARRLCTFDEAHLAVIVRCFLSLQHALEERHFQDELSQVPHFLHAGVVPILFRLQSCHPVRSDESAAASTPLLRSPHHSFHRFHLLLHLSEGNLLRERRVRRTYLHHRQAIKPHVTECSVARDDHRTIAGTCGLLRCLSSRRRVCSCTHNQSDLSARVDRPGRLRMRPGTYGCVGRQ